MSLSPRGGGSTGFGYVSVRVLLPFPFHGRFYDSRRPLLSSPLFPTFSDTNQKSDEMKAESRLDERRGTLIIHRAGAPTTTAERIRIKL